MRRRSPPVLGTELKTLLNRPAVLSLIPLKKEIQMRIAVKNPRTGDWKWLAVGWNWSFLFFSPCLGIPLFRKGLPVWGAVMLLLGSLEFVTSDLSTDTLPDLQTAIALAAAGVSAYLAWKGNALIARKWLSHGYDFVQPGSPDVRYACERWGIDESPRSELLT